MMFDIRQLADDRKLFELTLNRPTKEDIQVKIKEIKGERKFRTIGFIFRRFDVLRTIESHCPDLKACDKETPSRQ
jgi:hypothetical protein